MALSETPSLASDKAIRPFLAPTFDPADFLNAILPTWTPNPHRTSTVNPTSSSLTDLNTQTQTLLSQLNAQLTRLSSTLTRLTDEILRSGSRLTYEVEVLRADTTGLSDVLSANLAKDIARFAQADSVDASEANAAVHAARLRTLALVRDRLESVIKTFGAAIDWALQPSEVSFRSSIISISGPGADTAALEERGKTYAERVRVEIAELLAHGEVQAEQAAVKRVDDLRELAKVWKGTSEEKPRMKFVESLTKMVEEGQRPKMDDTGYRLREESRTRSSSTRR